MMCSTVLISQLNPLRSELFESADLSRVDRVVDDTSDQNRSPFCNVLGLPPPRPQLLPHRGMSY